MEIRKSTAQDLEQIMALYEQARDFMRQSGNPNQWGNAYPSREMISADIAAGKSYLCLEGGRIAAVFYFAVEEEPTYRVIQQGSWLCPGPYGVVHRTASHPAGRCGAQPPFASHGATGSAAICASIPTGKISPCSAASSAMVFPIAASSTLQMEASASLSRNLPRENLCKRAGAAFHHGLRPISYNRIVAQKPNKKEPNGSFL